MLVARKCKLLQITAVLICVVLSTVISDGRLMMRLVGGPHNSSGRLEVNSGGGWGIVCDDYFDAKAATVACKAFGYTYGVETVNVFGMSDEDAPIWLDDVKCLGNESSLLDCPHAPWGKHNCGHREAVAVICSYYDGQLVVRLVDGPNNSSGRLEVKGGGIWGTVCDDYFDQRAATVACKSIGWNYGLRSGQDFGNANVADPIWLNIRRCYGNESSLLDCSHRGWGKHSCHHSEDVSVICVNYDGHLVARLIDGPNNSSGRLEVKAGGRWGTVCSGLLDPRAATVVCRRFGYNYGVGLPTTWKFGTNNRSDPIWLDHVRCLGNESSLLECSHRAWGVHSCTHTNDMNVICDNYDVGGPLSVRLVDGPDPSFGRLEVKAGGRWGTVCYNSFDQRAATIVCKHLGYSYGYSVRAEFGKGKADTPIWLDEVVCTGNESSLYECSHREWGIHNCVHDEDVSVMCEPVAVIDWFGAVAWILFGISVLVIIALSVAFILTTRPRRNNTETPQEQPVAYDGSDAALYVNVPDGHRTPQDTSQQGNDLHLDKMILPVGETSTDGAAGSGNTAYQHLHEDADLPPGFPERQSANIYDHVRNC